MKTENKVVGLMISVAVAAVVFALGFKACEAARLGHPYTEYPDLVRHLKPGGDEKQAVALIESFPQLARDEIRYVYYNPAPRVIRSQYHPLHMAAEYGRLEAARAMIEAGADVNATTRNGITPLRQAVEAPQNSGALTRLLLESGATLAPDPVALGYHAVLKGEPEVIRLLLERGVDVNRSKTRETLLGAALVRGRTDLVPILVEAGGTAPESAVNQALAWGKNETVNLYRQLTKER